MLAWRVTCSLQTAYIYDRLGGDSKDYHNADLAFAFSHSW